MTLSFSTQLNGKPTFFVDKILQCLNTDLNISWQKLKPLFMKSLHKYPIAQHAPIKLFIYEKKHTIRKDNSDKWKAGNLIHFVINNRTPKRYQFAPIIKCVSTQKIAIIYWYCKNTKLFDLPMVLIDNKILSNKQIQALAINDGFDNETEFFKYFDKNFFGKIIHWTNTKY